MVNKKLLMSLGVLMQLIGLVCIGKLVIILSKTIEKREYAILISLVVGGALIILGGRMYRSAK